MNTGRAMIVLAGGRSSRMGRDKAWLPWGDAPILLHVVQAGLAAGVDEVVVVGAPGVQLPALPPGVVRVDDPVSRRFEGPLSGLVAGLDRLADRGLALASISPCDAPWMSAAHVRFVLDRLEEVADRRAVVPVSEDEDTGEGENARSHLHPLCGAVRVQPALAAARSLLDAGQRAARALFTELEADPIASSSLPDPRVVHGCNTPEQWARARAARGEGSSPS